MRQYKGMRMRLNKLLTYRGRSGKYSKSEIIEMVYKALDNPATVYDQGFGR